jgi:hypothetical protein
MSTNEQKFNVKAGTGEKWVSTFEVEELVAAVIAKCAEVAAQKSPEAGEAVKSVKANLNFYSNLFIK